MKFGMHNEKYNRASAGGIRKEQWRLYEHGKYANDVDTSKSHLNEYDGVKNWQEKYLEAIKLTEETNGKKCRKDTVVVNSIVETVPESWGKDKALEYFQEQDKMIKAFLKEKGVEEKWLLSSVKHFDETNPHRTFTFIPVKDNKLQNKNIVNQNFLQQLQSRGWEVYQNFQKKYPELEELEKYEVGSKAKHKTELEYKTEKLEKKVEHLENKRDQVQGDVKTLSEINSIKPKKDILGHLSNITLDQFNKVKKMALSAYKWREKYMNLKQDNDLLINEYRKLDAKYEDLKEKTPSVIELAKLNRAKKILDLIPERVQREYAPHILGKEKKRERSQERQGA